MLEGVDFKEEYYVHRKVRGTSAVRLNVDSPLGLVQTIRLESTFLTQLLDLIDVLVTTVVSLVRQSLGVLVRETRSKTCLCVCVCVCVSVCVYLSV